VFLRLHPLQNIKLLQEVEEKLIAYETLFDFEKVAPVR